MSGGETRHPSARGSTVPKPKIAAVERRKASRSPDESAPAEARKGGGGD